MRQIILVVGNGMFRVRSWPLGFGHAVGVVRGDGHQFWVALTRPPPALGISLPITGDVWSDAATQNHGLEGDIGGAGFYVK